MKQFPLLPLTVSKPSSTHRIVHINPSLEPPIQHRHLFHEPKKWDLPSPFQTSTRTSLSSQDHELPSPMIPLSTARSTTASLCPRPSNSTQSNPPIPPLAQSLTVQSKQTLLFCSRIQIPEPHPLLSKGQTKPSKQAWKERPAPNRLPAPGTPAHSTPHIPPSIGSHLFGKQTPCSPELQNKVPHLVRFSLVENDAVFDVFQGCFTVLNGRSMV